MCSEMCLEILLVVIELEVLLDIAVLVTHRVQSMR